MIIEKKLFFNIDKTFIVDNYIYIKVIIRPILNSQDLMVCRDINISRFFVVRSFLSYFKDIKIIQIKAPAKISGYLNPIIKFKEWII